MKYNPIQIEHQIKSQIRR